MKVPDSPSMEKEEMESAPSPVGFGEALVRRLPLRVVSSSVGDGFTGVGEGVINGVDGDVQSGVDGGADAIGDGVSDFRNGAVVVGGWNEASDMCRWN